MRQTATKPKTHSTGKPTNKESREHKSHDQTGVLMTTDEYVDKVVHRVLKGHGNPVSNDLVDTDIIVTGRAVDLPENATHVLWYQK